MRCMADSCGYWTDFWLFLRRKEKHTKALNFYTRISYLTPILHHKTLHARAYCPRKGAHFVKNAVQAERKASALAFPRRSRHCRETENIRSHFLSGDFSARAFSTTSLSNDVSQDTHAEVPVRQVPCAHPLCEAGVCSEVPFHGPVAASEFTYHLRNAVD